MRRALIGTLVACILMLAAIALFLISYQFYAPDHTHSPLEFVGSFIGGVSLFVTAIAIWFEANTITARNFQVDQYVNAVNAFRSIYDEFWTEDDIAEVRCWLVSEVEYNENLRGILADRCKSEINSLKHEHNHKLDKLDRFLAVLVRIRSFNTSLEYSLINDEQKKLWNKVLNLAFWISMIYKTRPELWLYLNKYWKDELVPLHAPETYDPNFKIEFPAVTRQYELQNIWPKGRRRGWRGVVFLNIFE